MYELKDTLEKRATLAREASVKLGGKDITKAIPENRTLQILPGKTLKKLCK